MKKCLLFLLSLLGLSCGFNLNLFAADVTIQDSSVSGFLSGTFYYDSARDMQRIDYRIGSATYYELTNFDEGIYYLKCPSQCEAQSISYPIPSYSNPGTNNLNDGPSQCRTGSAISANSNNPRAVWKIYSYSNGLPCRAVFGQGARTIDFSNIRDVPSNVRPVLSGGKWNPSQMVINGCPEKDCAIRIDVSFVMDNSGSVGSSNFEKEKRFVREVATSFAISPQEARINVALFGVSAYVPLSISRGVDKTVVENEINRIGFGSERATCMPCGMSVARQDIQSVAFRDVFRLMILISDGFNNVGTQQQFTDEIARAKAFYSLILSIGVGGSVSESQMRAVATDPSQTTLSQTYFPADNFDDLLNIIPTIVSVTCLDIPGNPCGSGCKGFCACRPPNQNTRQCICPSSCGDGNACTTESCDPSKNGAGCIYSPVICSDGNACTDDSCDPQTGCVYTPFTEDRCNDNNLCTEDKCDPASGCVHPPNATNCKDNDGCTYDLCSPATGCYYQNYSQADCDKCTQFGTVTCPPVNCKVNGQCNPATGDCEYTDRDCEDGSKCTDNSCDVATGDCVTTPVNCDDGDPCTIDGCDKDTGCFNTPVNETEFCDDNNACTIDTCVKGKGCQHEAVNCSDGDVCTNDHCGSLVGCYYTTKSCASLTYIRAKLGDCYTTLCNDTRAKDIENNGEEGLNVEYVGEGCFIEQLPNTTLDKCGCCEGFECSCDAVAPPEDQSVVLGGLALAAVILAVVGVVVILGLLSGKKGYDIYLAHRGNMNEANTNPLYNADGLSGTNPMYAAEE